MILVLELVLSLVLVKACVSVEVSYFFMFDDKILIPNSNPNLRLFEISNALITKSYKVPRFIHVHSLNMRIHIIRNSA